MPVEVILPKVDMDMETGTIEAWHVKEGDQVRQGETIFEIGTNKAVMEVEAPASGAIRRIRAETGIAIAVGTPVAWIYLDGEAADAAPAATPAAAPPQQPAAAAAVVANQASNDVAAGAAPAGLRATPLARRVARQNGIDLRTISGTGPRGRIGEADVTSALILRSDPQGRVSKDAAEGGSGASAAILRDAANAAPQDEG